MPASSAIVRPSRRLLLALTPLLAVALIASLAAHILNARNREPRPLVTPSELVGGPFGSRPSRPVAEPSQSAAGSA
jgi:hypothetical protein